MSSGGPDAEDRSVLERPARTPDRVSAYGPGREQIADVYLPSGVPRGPVVLVHGGFWRPEYDRGHLRPMAAALADVGHPVLLPEYERSPGDPDAGLADLRLALALAATELPSGPPALVGHSAGGQLALVLAVDAGFPLTGVLALAPVADLVDAERADLDAGAVRDYLGGPAWLRPDLDPCRATRPAIPVRIVHGMSDALVPLRLSQTYAYRQRASVAALSGTGHFALIDPLSTAWPTVLAELAALTGARGIE